MSLSIEVARELLQLNPDRTVYWPAQHMLLIADVHLGKASHFRREGIAVPKTIGDQTLIRLNKAIESWQPKRVLFLGDLFHSHYNSEWEDLGALIKKHSKISFELTLGNHDLLTDYQYLKGGIIVYSDKLSVGPFCFTHDPKDAPDSGCYNLAGHVHPVVRLLGAARQSVRLPCFYFGRHSGLLPAFGKFTGGYKVLPEKGDKVFVVAENRVLRVG